MDPLRFGLVWSGGTSPIEAARRAEDAGYSSLLFPDHTGMVAPLPAMAAAAVVTSRVRLGTQVINVAFRPLGALAQELAAIDILSEGRLDIGLGAGYAEAEVLSLGLRFPSAGDRVREVARTLDVLPRLFAGEVVSEDVGEDGRWGHLVDYRLSPLPPQGASVPLLVGGNADKLLKVAAEQADIVQLVGFSPRASGYDFGKFSDAGLADRITHVRNMAGDRFDDIQLSILVQWAGVVADPQKALQGLLAAGSVPGSAEQVLQSPFVLLGSSVDEICAKVIDLRERHGVTYIAVFDGQSDGFDEVVEKLSGRT